MAAVMANTHFDIPTQQVAIVFDAALSPPIRFLECEAAGTVNIVDASGAEVQRTVVAGKRIDLAIQMVKSGGSVAADKLIGYR